MSWYQSNCHRQQINARFLQPDALPVAQWPVSKYWRETSGIEFFLNKLCGSRHNMPPPISSFCGRWSASRRRVDRVWPQRSSRFPRWIVTTAAAWCINPAVSKVAWWPWPLTLTVVSESRMTWATSMPILVFLGLSVHDLGPMSDRQMSDSIID